MRESARREPGARVRKSGITMGWSVRDTEAGATWATPVTADDPDGDALTYTITGGADMGSFEIDADNTGQITVKEGTMLDFEGSKTTYVVEVKADDPFGLSDTMVTITVINVNEPPDLMLIVEPEPQPARHRGGNGDALSTTRRTARERSGRTHRRR